MENFKKVLKLIAEMPGNTLNDIVGIKPGLDDKVSIDKEINKYRSLSARPFIHKEGVILESLKLTNMCLAYGITEDQLEKVMRQWAQGKVKI